MYTHIVGVDEAGRGPLAGPVSVGVAIIPRNFNWDLIPGVGDSKKVSEKKREVIFGLAKKLKKENKLNYYVILIPPSTIDRINISRAVALGIMRAFSKLQPDPKQVDVRLDGSLKAPDIYARQQTIIKGDAKEKVIGLASILAKVTRDRHMVRLAKKYPQYNLDIHKGYGTKDHRARIKKFGLSSIHRKTFCKNIFT